MPNIFKLFKADVSTDVSNVSTEIKNTIAGAPNGAKILRDDWSWQTSSGGGNVTGPGSSTDNAIARWDGTGGTTAQNSGATIDDNGTIKPIATAAGFPSVQLTAGTLQTTPVAGGIEMDANCVYLATDAGNRGVVPVVHYIRADATRTLPNDANENAIFNSPANGRLTLETGVYLFEGLISVSSMSATSGNALLDILGAGTATCAAWLWHAVGADGNANTAATQTGSTTNTQQSAASILTAGTGTSMHVSVKGTFEVTGAGTLIPSIDQVTAAAAVVAIGSYLCVWRIGATTAVSVGQWD